MSSASSLLTMRMVHSLLALLPVAVVAALFLASFVSTILVKNDSLKHNRKDVKGQQNHPSTTSIAPTPLLLFSEDNVSPHNQQQQQQYHRVTTQDDHQEQDCVDPGLIDFQRNQLGPIVLKNTSLFRTFGVAIVENGTSESTFDIPILKLAQAANQYRVEDDNMVFPPFTQETETFGQNGEYTEILLQQHQHLLEFWKISNHDIDLVGLHSDVLQQQSRMAAGIYKYLEEHKAPFLETETYVELASRAMKAIETELPQGYSNPMLTLSAYTKTITENKNNLSSSFRIVLGDGVMEYLSYSLGEGEDVGEATTIAAQVVHAHQFGHVLQSLVAAAQMENNFNKNTPTSTPRTWVLTSDAFAGYFLAHLKGQNLTSNQLMNMARALYAVGDCNFNSTESHYGTPRQRACASLWGAHMATTAADDEEKMPLRFDEFYFMFQENLDSILDLDENVCALSDSIAPPSASPPNYPTSGGSSFSIVIGSRVMMMWLVGIFVAAI